MKTPAHKSALLVAFASLACVAVVATVYPQNTPEVQTAAPAGTAPVPGTAATLSAINGASADARDKLLDQVNSSMDQIRQAEADLWRTGQNLTGDARKGFETSYNALEDRENDLHWSITGARLADTYDWDAARANLASKYKGYVAAIAAMQAAALVPNPPDVSIADGAPVSTAPAQPADSASPAISNAVAPAQMAAQSSTTVPADMPAAPTLEAPEAAKSFSAMMDDPDTVRTLNEMEFGARESELSFITGRVDAAAQYLAELRDDSGTANNKTALSGSAYAKLLEREKELRNSLEKAEVAKQKKWIEARTKLASDYEAYVSTIAQVESMAPSNLHS